MTDTKERTQHEEAVRSRDYLERRINVLRAVQDRNYGSNEPWDDLYERLCEYHIPDPLCITWHGDTDTNPSYGDAEWTVTHVEVLLGTGGPAYGINFQSDNDADLWHQSWFTTKAPVPMDPDVAAFLASHWGLELT